MKTHSAGMYEVNRIWPYIATGPNQTPDASPNRPARAAGKPWEVSAALFPDFLSCSYSSSL